jgi:tellurite resistance protein
VTTVSDAFERRRRTFEAEYFSRKEAHLVNKLKQIFDKKIDKESVRKATGIKNERLLDNLVALNFSGDLMAAFNLLPLVEVAWADGAVDEREVRALMTALEQQGILPGTPAYARLEFSIKHGPDPEAKKLWYLYAEELKNTLSPKELAEFRQDILDTARTIANVSGGLLNIAFTISPNEQRVLDAVEKALTV